MVSNFICGELRIPQKFVILCREFVEGVSQRDGNFVRMEYNV